MAKKEAKTDLWVYDLLKEAGICLDPQGCSIKEVDEALKTASKKGTGNVGYPEYAGVVGDFLLVIEDKSDLSKHVKYDDKDLLDKAKTAQQNFLKNGVRTIILLDEIDRVGYEGSFIQGSLKRFLEKCSDEYHCTVFATTNNPLALSNPLCSEKRMPIKVNIDPPNHENAKAIFRHYLKECPNVNLDSIDLDALANEICSVKPDRTYNASNIEKIVEDCAKNYQTLTQDDIIYEIRKKEPGIKKDALEKYKNETEQLGGNIDA